MFVVTANGSAVGAAYDQWTAHAIAARIEGATVVEQPGGLDYQEAEAVLERQCKRLDISVNWTFIPFSQSRCAGDKSPSLNWKADIPRLGLKGVDYTQGSYFAPSYKRTDWSTSRLSKREAIAQECETGRHFTTREAIAPPSVVDIMGCLGKDAPVLDYSSFEAWAPELGFDPDSRRAESIYQTCLAQTLAIRAAIGEAELHSLRVLAMQL